MVRIPPETEGQISMSQVLCYGNIMPTNNMSYARRYDLDAATRTQYPLVIA